MGKRTPQILYLVGDVLQDSHVLVQNSTICKDKTGDVPFGVDGVEVDV